MIDVMLTISTAHVSSDDARKFDNLAGSPAVPILYKNESGWVFYRLESKEELVESLQDAGVTCVAIDVLVHAFFVMDVDFVRMDSCGEQLKGFPVFDW